ncbi:MAG: hypothetical protein IKE69_03585 [Thermoguttaceae bacterium]|nr:hypothetical protein [Thermoguttaceae bacterium]
MTPFDLSYGAFFPPFRRGKGENRVKPKKTEKILKLSDFGTFFAFINICRS